MTSVFKTVSKWLEVPHPILSCELRQVLESLLEVVNSILRLEEIENEKALREIVSKLPQVSCTYTNDDAGIVKVTFLSLEFPSLDTNRFVYELFDRFVLSKSRCFELESKAYTFEFKAKDMPRLYVADYLIHLSEKQSYERFKEKVMILKEQLRLALLNKNFSFRLALSHHVRLDRKITAIHSQVLRYIEEKGEEFDTQFLLDVDRWLMVFSQDFLEKRSPLLLAKALFNLISIRRELEWKETIDSSKRHIQLSFFPSSLSFTFGTKPVLGCTIGVGLNPSCERFVEKHLSSALEAVIPSANLSISPEVHLEKSNIQMMYVEFEKEDGMRFTDEEIDKLKFQLPIEIEARVQRFVPELFMVRNEEEIMKNILTLTKEIRSAEDFPQVTVRYEQHDEETLVFCVILVRILKEGQDSVTEAFSKVNHSLTLIPERTQIVSYLGGKDPVEANVFRVQLSDVNPFTRRNFSFNFFEARHHVIEVIEAAVGEIRDYNGGMILKQSENLVRFKQAFSEVDSENPEFLEKFFYSLNPIEIQATIETESLKLFFETFSSLLEAEEEGFFSYRFHRKGSQLFLFTRCNDHHFRTAFEEELEKQDLKHKLMISSSLLHHGFRYEGVIFDNHEEIELQLEGILKTYLKHQIKPKVLNLNLETKIFLDPRIGGDHQSSMINKMLFEGLMRLDEQGTPQLAIAEKVEVSDDQTRYLFTLRESYWSNGMKVLAEDFEYAWKKILSPGFNTRFAYLFYPIKNARLAKEGQCSVDEVKVKALDDTHLEIHLETPTPYFLESTTLGLYSPVNSYIDRIHPNWAQERGDRFICNGPFRLRENRSFYAFELVKNHRFWNQDSIKLDHILLSRVNSRKATELFCTKKLDWLGPPLGYGRSNFSQLGEKIHYLPTTKSLWYLFNNQIFPFTNHKIRQAFCLAVNRCEIIGTNRDCMLPAYSHLPLNHTELFRGHEGMEENSERAEQLFKEGLDELGISKREFPQVTVIHYNSEASNRTSHLLKKQWREILGISCRIEPYEFADLFERLGRGEFQVGCFCWISWINDPIYTLNIYRNRDEKLNVFFWEDREYQTLLDLADHELDLDKRLEYLHEAAKIFSNQHLILPIYYEYERFLKSENLQVPIINNLGFVNYAYSRFK